MATQRSSTNLRAQPDMLPGSPAASDGSRARNGVSVRIRPWLFDIVLTAVLAVAGFFLLFTYVPDDGIDYREADVLGVVLVFAYTVPLVFRRASPLTVAVVLAVLNLPFVVWSYSAPIAAVVGLIAAYSLGAHTTVARGLAGIAAMLAGTYVYMWVTHDQFPEADDVGRIDALIVALIFFGAWAIGRSVRVPRMQAQHLKERAEQIERTHEAEVRAAIAEERAQIARELHDVVAHHVSVMTVQAAGARRALERDPDQSRQALEAIEATGRTALAEMRRVVGVLRSRRTDTGTSTAGSRGEATDAVAEGPARTPQPGGADLPELVHQLRAAGLDVTLTTENDRVVTPSIGVDLAVYRIVQEALTNTLKHAPGARAEVAVRYGPRDVEVVVADNGPGRRAASPGMRPGHGLLGMRERVVVYGGELKAGDRPGGGFEVRARLPMMAEP